MVPSSNSYSLLPPANTCLISIIISAIRCSFFRISSTSFSGGKCSKSVLPLGFLMSRLQSFESACLEEDQVSRDTSVRRKDAIGQAYDGMQIKANKQLSLDLRCYTSSKEKAIGQDN